MTNKGFTLIEIVVTLLILSVVAALSVPAFLEGEGSRTDLDAAQGRLEALFNLARDSAVRTATPITVALDSTTGFAWLDARSSRDAQLMDSSATDAGAGTRSPHRTIHRQRSAVCFNDPAARGIYCRTAAALP